MTTEELIKTLQGFVERNPMLRTAPARIQVHTGKRTSKEVEISGIGGRWPDTPGKATTVLSCDIRKPEKDE